MNDNAPNTPGWYWQKTHWDNYRLIGPDADATKLKGANYVRSLDGPPVFNFRDYPSLCWFCGTHGINAVQA